MTWSDAPLAEFLPGDATCDGFVSVPDLIAVIIAWGRRDHPADLDGDRVVAVGDLIAVILNWGASL